MLKKPSLFSVSRRFFLQVTSVAILSTVFILCLVAPCNFELTPEHVAQISTSRINKITQERCLGRGYNDESEDYVIAYCPNEQICGMGLNPNDTSVLKLLSPKSCFVFVSMVSFCTEFQQQLRINGLSYINFLIHTSDEISGTENEA